MAAVPPDGIHKRTCPLCEAMCGLLVHVEEGRVAKIRPNFDDVWSKGYICPKGTTLGHLHHDPDRVRTPLVKQDGRFAVDAGDFKVVIPESRDGKRFESYVGKPVVFGVRPEDIFDKTITIAKPTEENTITAMVDVIEPMGAIVTAYLTVGKHSLVATIDAETKMIEEKDMEFVLDMEKTHVFDKDTELAIY